VAKYVIRLTNVQGDIEGKRRDERVRRDEENPTRVDRLRSQASPDRPGPSSVQMLGERLPVCLCSLRSVEGSLHVAHYPAHTTPPLGSPSTVALSTGDADISCIPENPDSEVELPM
jgi:hypothetical protein